MSYSIDVDVPGVTVTGYDQFPFIFDGKENITIDICYLPPEPQKLVDGLDANNNNVAQQPITEVCKAIYITSPFSSSSNVTMVQTPWNVEGNMVGVGMLCIALPIVSSICLFFYTKMLLMRENHHILKNKDGEIRPPKAGFGCFSNPVWLLSFTFTAWYCLVMCGVIVFAYTYPYLFNTLNEHLPIVDWAQIIIYVRIVGIVIIIIDTVLTLLMWLPTYVLKVRLWEMYYRLIGDEVNAEKYKKRKAFYHAHRFIQFGFVVAFGLLLVSMMLSIVIAVVAVTAVGFAYMFSTACLDVVKPLDGVCVSWEYIGGGQYCGDQLVVFCNSWRMLQSSLIFWSAVVVAVGHYYLIGTGGMSFYQQVSVNILLDAMKDELLNETSIEKESSEKDNEEIIQRESSEKYDEENKNVAMTAVSLGGDVTTVLEQDDTTTGNTQAQY